MNFDLTADERALLESHLKPIVRRLRADDLERELIERHLCGRQNAHPALAKIALTEVEADANRIIELRDPAAITGSRSHWYAGSGPFDRCWPALKRVHEASGKWTTSDLASLNSAAERIVAEMPAPGIPRFKSKGLVIGYVQSGKTASYTAVISKAADAGYKLFIVVAGITERLREQTQKRLARELVALNQGSWHTITDPAWDFSAQHLTMQAAAILSPVNGQFVLGVLKKNSSRLKRLYQWLNSARAQLVDCPVLIIDDEADEASINTAKQANARSTINRRLFELIDVLPRVSYVAYTATPFANLLIAPDDPATGGLSDLYPSNFIIDLPKPPAYIGAERVFGRSTLPSDDANDAQYEGLDLVRTIPDDDSHALKVPSPDERFTFTPPVVPSLEAAVRWFIIASAIRRARGEADQHMTMLVHTSQYVAVHRSTKEMLRRLLDSILTECRTSNSAFSAAMHALWLTEHDRVPPDTPLYSSNWPDIQQHLQESLESTKVFVENGLSREVDFDAGTVHGIVVGGNVLSRGLTIEGLTVSYFLRTASAYDTLMQMGRWFGYRPGYLDLSRIWLPTELQRHFADLATVEEEVRVDIRRYAAEKLTPTQFAVRIRLHSTLLVTSALKMRNAVSVKVGYAGREVSTRVFYRTDATWLSKGWQAGARLVDRIQHRRDNSNSGSDDIVFRDVPAAEVLAFLDEYPVHVDCGEFNKQFLAEYIRHAIEKQNGRLSVWNVVVVQRQKRVSDRFEALGTSAQVRLVTRSRMKDDAPEKNYADIRALTSEGDAGADLEPPAYARPVTRREEILRLREDELPSVGLLLLYPIDKDSSAPNTSKTNKMALQAATHILAAAIVIPGLPKDQQAGQLLEHDYISADLSRIEIEEPEEEVFVETEDGIAVSGV